MSYSSEILADSPGIFLKLDEASGTTAADSSGNSRSFTATSVTWAQTSLFVDGVGTSATLNGTTAYLTRASETWMNSSSVTVVFRYKHTTAAGNRMFVGRWNGVGTQPWLFYVAANKLVVQLNSAGSPNVTGATTLANGTTYTVAMRTNGSTCQVFLDGVSDASISHAGPTQTSAPFEIGRAAVSAFAPGQLDGLAFWASAISDARLAAYHTAAVTSNVAAVTSTATAAAVVPTVAANSTVTAVAATATASAPAPTVSGNNEVSAVAATATATAMAPTVTADAPAVAAVAATATAAALAPIVSGNNAATVAAVTATATADAIAPTVTADATAAAAAATATADAYAPVVTGGSGGATVLAPAATATASGIAPAVSAGASIVAVKATATATAQPPTWTQVLVAEADISNALDGLDIVATGFATVTTPTASPPSNLAERVDKAVAYPEPVMVNGRPT